LILILELQHFRGIVLNSSAKFCTRQENIRSRHWSALARGPLRITYKLCLQVTKKWPTLRTSLQFGSREQTAIHIYKSATSLLQNPPHGTRLCWECSISRDI